MRKYAPIRDQAQSMQPGSTRYRPAISYKSRIPIMEAERINLIGTKLADLSARTLELRGYL
jgi:hypothetical protein